MMRYNDENECVTELFGGNFSPINIRTKFPLRLPKILLQVGDWVYIKMGG